MNIIILNDHASVNGGAAKVAIDSAIGLTKQGNFVTFFSVVGPIDPELIENGVNVVCLQQMDILNDPNRFRAAISGIWNIHAAKEMKNLLRHFSTENTIIHVHSWTKALSSSPIRVATKKNFKVLLTLHDYFTACPNGGFFDFPTGRICHKIPLSFSCISQNCDARSYPQKLWRVVRQIVQKNLGLIPGGITYFISVSQFSLSILNKYLPTNSMIEEIQNPINWEQPSPVEIGNNKSFVFLGRLSDEKGVLLFAEAIQKLGISGIVIGDGPLLSIMKKRYPELAYYGWLSSSDVKNVLRDARSLVFPSLLYETQGITVFEAMSLGIPTIVADTSAAREFVTDGKTGLWFKGGDVNDLIDKITQLHKDNKLVNKLGHTAYEEFWEKNNTLEKYVNALSGFYRKIIK